jgi:hypothetical protein
MAIMKTFLAIPQAEYDSLRASLDAALGYPNDVAPTSLLPKLKPSADGNCYTAVPAEWPTDLTAKYVVDEATWMARARLIGS